MVSGEYQEFQRVRKEAVQFLLGEPKKYGEVREDGDLIRITINIENEEIRNIADQVKDILGDAGAQEGRGLLTHDKEAINMDKLLTTLRTTSEKFECLIVPDILERAHEKINKRTR